MTETESEPPVSRVSRRELMASGMTLGATALASQYGIEDVLAQSGGPSNEISGIVEDGSGGVSGATVVAVPHDETLSPLVTTTASDGAYTFSESDLYEGENLYHVIARDGTETDPRRGQQNYPFIAAEGPAGIPDSVTDHWPAGEGSGSTLSNDRGSVDIDLIGATWDSGSRYFDGAGVVLDGTDDRWESQSSFGVNNQQFSFACWLFDYAGADAATPVAWSGGGSIPDDGWIVQVVTGSDNDDLRLRYQSGGSASVPVETSLSPDGTSYFIGAAGDGDAGDLYVWDTSQQIISQSGTGTRGGIGTDSVLSGGGRTDAARYLTSILDTPFFSTSSRLSEAEFADLWEYTRP